MMSVSLDMLDAKQRHHCQVLEQSHRAEVAQVLARQYHPGALPPPSFQQAGVGDAFDDAFAILVARSGVAEFEGTRQVPDRAVGLVDDQGRSVRPLARCRAWIIAQSAVAM